MRRRTMRVGALAAAVLVFSACAPDAEAPRPADPTATVQDTVTQEALITYGQLVHCPSFPVPTNTFEITPGGGVYPPSPQHTEPVEVYWPRGAVSSDQRIQISALYPDSAAVRFQPPSADSVRFDRAVLVRVALAGCNVGSRDDLMVVRLGAGPRQGRPVPFLRFGDSVDFIVRSFSDYAVAVP